MSHEDVVAGTQAEVTNARLVPVFVQDHCVATVPGAIASTAVADADRSVET
jgi:hypothetical protein